MIAQAAPDQHWTAKYLRIPYLRGGDTHAGCDCWGLFRLVQRERYGIDVPLVPLDDINHRVAAIATHRRDRWCEVLEPGDGDAVQMTQAAYPSHVGIWVGETHGHRNGRSLGLVLHTTEMGGVRLQNLLSLRAQHFNVKRFYRHAY